MADTVEIGGLKVDRCLYRLVLDEIAPGTGVDGDVFWSELGKIVGDLGDKNRTLLEKRDTLQKQIDEWNLAHKGQPIEMEKHKEFLIEIGYLLPEGEDFRITTSNVDAEIATIAGPQLVVPVDNARYALNAANARWGSIFDAFYGTDLISEENEADKRFTYNPIRGELVIAETSAFLDEVIALESGTYSEVTQFQFQGQNLIARLGKDRTVGLADPNKFVGYTKTENELSGILLRNNGLHIEILLDPESPVGKVHPAGIKDILLEAAITTIQDCEDSVAAVDAMDKARVYRNWTGIMKGTLETSFEKNGESIIRQLNPDKTFLTPEGDILTLPGRSLLLIRNVGIHMYTDAAVTSDGEPIPEAFLDAMITSLAAMHDLKGNGKYTNSRMGSIYIVKPKFHGLEEVEAAVELFERVEEALGLERNTVKIGIMDEERRTTINLKETLRVAKERVVFINTGFLDRTGDEIHTGMELGPMLPKMEIKSQPWINAYEDWNVDIGIETGLVGKAQIGKGMWAMPDLMREMFESKISHPQAGASTAWVPSPTAAVIHAIHYHKVNVAERQNQLAGRKRANLDHILTPPILDRELSASEIQQELNNNAQGILGYVVRWVDQGIGCSKVPDIHEVALMEDRATLRISSQHIANWLHHRIVTKEQVVETFKEMAEVVDEQNAADKNYRNMSPEFDESIAFQAALDLVFDGRAISNGYTEPALHRRRRQAKMANGIDASSSQPA